MNMAKINVNLYGELVNLTQKKIIKVNVSTIKEAIDQLVANHGEKLKERIYKEKGKIRRFINIYVNGKDIRFLDHLNTKLKEGDKVAIIPAVGGG
jgi:molybdopterin synthase sulfur carrier subunit